MSLVTSDGDNGHNGHGLPHVVYFGVFNATGLVETNNIYIYSSNTLIRAHMYTHSYAYTRSIRTGLNIILYYGVFRFTCWQLVEKSIQHVQMLIDGRMNGHWNSEKFAVSERLSNRSEQHTIRTMGFVATYTYIIETTCQKKMNRRDTTTYVYHITKGEVSWCQRVFLAFLYFH